MFLYPFLDRRIVRRGRRAAGNSSGEMGDISGWRLARLLSHIAQDFVSQSHTIFVGPWRNLTQNPRYFFFVSHPFGILTSAIQASHRNPGHRFKQHQRQIRLPPNPSSNRRSPEST
jgi:hypothetical protein